MTASERATQLNVQAEELVFGFSLVTDAGHWAGYGIHTGEELDAYLAWSEWVDIYKETHGIKPRWTSWRDRSSAGWESEIKSDIDSLNAQAEVEEAESRAREAALEATRGPVVSLTWSPFAALSGR